MKHFWAAALATLFAASPSWAQTNTITLGAAVQLTGKDANTGRYYRDAYQLTVDQINEKGGVTVAGKKYTLRLVLLDTQSDANLAVQLYNQLVVREKVDFLLGAYSSTDVLNTSSVAEKYEVPMVQGGGASGQIFSRGYKYIFGTLPRAEDYFNSTLQMLSGLEPKSKTVALVVADDAFDVAVGDGTRQLLKKGGYDIVLDQQYTQKSTDFSSILALVKSKSPDIILWGGLAPEVLDEIRQAKSLDVNPKNLISFTVGVPTSDFRKALGKDAEFAFGMTPWVPTGSLKDDWFGDDAVFNKQFIAKYNYEPDYHAASAASDVEVFAKAIPAAGSLDKKAVRDAIAKVDFQSVYGRVKFTENGQIDLPQIVVQVQDGQIVPIFSDHVLSKPRYPVPAWDQRK